MEDSSGRIWIGTDKNGLNILLPPREKETTNEDAWSPGKIRILGFRHDPGDPGGLSHDDVWAICEDRAGHVWVGTDGGGLNRVFMEPAAVHADDDAAAGLNLRFRRFKHRPGVPGALSDDSVQVIYEDSAGVLWIGTKNGGLNCFNPGDETFTVYRNIPGDPASLGHNNVTDIVEDRDGVLWIATNGGGLNSLPPGREPGKKRLIFTSHRHDLNDPYSLGDNIVISLYVDNTGTLWAGTLGNGVSKFDRKKYKFKHTAPRPNDPNSLNNAAVRSIFEDRSGIMWFGTNEGLNRFDPASGIFSHFQASAGIPRSLSHNVVRCIYEDSRGRLWVGTHGGGLNRVIRGRGAAGLEFIHYRHREGEANSLGNDVVIAISGDRSGDLWVGTSGGGLDRFNPDTRTFTNYKSVPGCTGCPGNNYIRAIYEDLSGTLWVGTNGGGLSKFHRESRTFTQYKHDPGDPGSIGSNHIFCIHQSPGAPGILWIGTFGGGLNRFDMNENTFTHYRTKDGLPNNVVYGILEAGKPGGKDVGQTGVLWLSTNRGLSRFDPGTGEFKNYSVSDGLQSNEFNAGAFFKNKRGEMFFGGVNGFNTFMPSSIKHNDHIPPIVLTNFKLFHRPVALAAERRGLDTGVKTLPKALDQLEEIRLEYYENFFSFEYSALDFTDPGKNRYAYQLEGVDKDWVPCGACGRNASYTSIAPGEYRFRVKGSNNDGAWNETGASIKIIVASPFWSTWWFLGVIAVLAALLILFFVRLRMNKIRYEAGQERLRLKREMEKQELENELKLKADFIAMLVHDMRSPLTAIMGYAELLGSDFERMDIGKVSSVISLSCEKMLNLINDMLDISKFEAGKMILKRRELSLEDLVKDMVDMLLPLLTRKELKICYDFSPLEHIALDRKKIGQVITNLVSNAVKFSPQGDAITIKTRSLSLNGRVFQEFSIADNGPGIPGDRRKYLFDKYAQLHQDRDMKGTGLGLAVSRIIVEAHGGEIGCLPGREKGSIFYFRVPQEAREAAGD
jgi:signal transduction histidine kinase/ligand-binding sensor domain-containing protein